LEYNKNTRTKYFCSQGDKYSKFVSKCVLQCVGASSSPATFTATVNDQSLTGRALAIDPYTANGTIIVHYLINKNQILDLGSSMTGGYGGGLITSDGNTTTAVNSNTNITGPSQNDMENVSTADKFATSSTDGKIDSMSFSLIPMADNTTTQYTSSDFTTDTGGIHAMVSWEPKQLRAGVESTIYVHFSDAFSGEALNANVIYDMSILDVNGKEVLRAENLTAINSTDSQTITFPTDKVYQVEVNVKGVHGGDDSSPDTTRSGIARGYVVVPEFSSSLSGSLMVAGLLAAVVTGMRWQKSRKKKPFSREYLL
jgi:ribosomal protein S9